MEKGRWRRPLGFLEYLPRLISLSNKFLDGWRWIWQKDGSSAGRFWRWFWGFLKVAKKFLQGSKKGVDSRDAVKRLRMQGGVEAVKFWQLQCSLFENQIANFMVLRKPQSILCP